MNNFPFFRVRSKNRVAKMLAPTGARYLRKRTGNGAAGRRRRRQEKARKDDATHSERVRCGNSARTPKFRLGLKGSYLLFDLGQCLESYACEATDLFHQGE